MLGNRIRALAASVAMATSLTSSCVVAAHPAAAEPIEPSTRSRGATLSPAVGAQARRGHFTSTGSVGDVVAWPAAETLDDGQDVYYLKDFERRAVSPHLEVWVAVGDETSTGLDFPEGDCRNGESTVVSDEQLRRLVDDFETRIWPAAREVFGAPDPRTGRNALLPNWEPAVPRDAYRGAGARQVVLVDNFRDEVFRTPGRPTPPGGFVDPFQIRLTDRNIVNLRGTDWAWAEGPTPRPTVADGCTIHAGVANGVQSLLAHEHAHVVHASVGPDFAALGQESAWLSEGLAQWMAHRAGFVDAASDDDSNFMVRCFLGQMPWPAPPGELGCPGGPSGSLTTFGEIGHPPAAEYGSVATFMEVLASRFGEDFLADLMHTEGLRGIAKVDSLLADRGADVRFADLVTDWAASLAVDAAIDDGADLVAGSTEDVQVDGLHASVGWSSPHASSRSGNPDGIAPNGSDFRILPEDLTSLEMDAATTLDCLWLLDDSAFYSGSANGQHKLLTTAVEVPTDDPVLRFDIRHDLEPGYDYAYVQVSTDGGATWRSLEGEGTTTEHAPDALAPIVADLPGYTGSSGGWRTEAIDLAAFAGEEVLVGLRFRSDPGIAGSGVWVDDVSMGNVPLADGTSFDGWEQRPPTADRVVAQLVSYDDHRTVAAVADVPLDSENDARLDGDELRALIAPGATTVALVVTLIEDDEWLFCPVRYRLTVDGVLQEES